MVFEFFWWRLGVVVSQITSAGAKGNFDENGYGLAQDRRGSAFETGLATVERRRARAPRPTHKRNTCTVTRVITGREG